MDVKQAIIDLFRTHPKTDTFYMTSDVQFFPEKTHADAQAQRLKDRGVATITRDQVQPYIDAQDKAAAADPSLAHPEQTTMLTAEELQQKQADDNTATAALDNLLNPEPGAEAALAAPAAPAEPTPAPAPAPAAEPTPAPAPAAEPAAEANNAEDAEIAADQEAVSEAQAKLDAALSNKKAKTNGQ